MQHSVDQNCATVVDICPKAQANGVGMILSCLIVRWSLRILKGGIFIHLITARYLSILVYRKIQSPAQCIQLYTGYGVDVMER